jgi:hypothetical protein
MNKLVTIALLLSFTTFASITLDKNKNYIGLRHEHTVAGEFAHDNIGKFAKHIINKGRVQLYEITDTPYAKFPPSIKKFTFKVKPKDLINPYTPVGNLKLNKSIDLKIEKALTKLSVSNYKNYVSNLVKLGVRRRGEGASYIANEFRKLGLSVEKDYNVLAKIEGKNPNSVVVIVGHMDTVRNTAGADDNASGASGVLEMARVLAETYADEKPANALYFLVTEDEEIGLKGAKAFIKAARSSGELSKLKFSINMDMIAYNSNGVVDLETDKKFEAHAKMMAEIAAKYTTLKTNLVLNPWGSDHMPFINSNIPAVLSIENWKTHTPCWHKSCDTIDTLNFDYAIELLKMNVATVMALD